MSELNTPEADFYEILQIRIDELDKEPYKHSEIVVEELKSLQTNFNSYLYRIKHKNQAD